MRLIDADKIVYSWQIDADGQEHDGVTLQSIIDKMPTIEPEIIACGDCKHWICHDRRCGYWNHGVKPLDWCCHAERRTE